MSKKRGKQDPTCLGEALQEGCEAAHEEEVERDVLVHARPLHLHRHQRTPELWADGSSTISHWYIKLSLKSVKKPFVKNDFVWVGVRTMRPLTI